MYDAKDVENLLERCKAEGKSKADTIRLLAELCLGWPYVWASQGERCTPEWRCNRIPYCREQKYADMIRDNCPVLCEKQPACYGCKWDGVLCFDCRGFTRKLCEWVGVPLFGESVTTQLETSSNWAVKGNIDTMPHGLVCCVFRPKHTGMYMGDETVIHCSGTVKRESLPGKPKWERWGIPAGLYTTDELRKAGVNVDESKNIPTLRRGSRGEQVKLLQETLNELPAGAALDLKVDGIFGAETEKAVRQFQADHGLTVDGIVGRKTWAALGMDHFADATQMIPDKLAQDVTDINIGDNASPPADAGVDISPLPDAERPDAGMVAVPLPDWQAIRAGIMAAYHVLQNYD